jgi:hypothetical protein
MCGSSVGLDDDQSATSKESSEEGQTLEATISYPRVGRPFFQISGLHHSAFPERLMDSLIERPLTVERDLDVASE